MRTGQAKGEQIEESTAGPRPQVVVDTAQVLRLPDRGIDQREERELPCRTSMGKHGRYEASMFRLAVATKKRFESYIKSKRRRPKIRPTSLVATLSGDQIRPL